MIQPSVPSLSCTRSLALIALALPLFAATAAQAGFQWVSPPPVTVEPPAAPMPDAVAPSAVVPPSVVAPVTMAAPVVAPFAEASLEGFANQVPLAVALRQILPENYAFAAEGGVDMGALVSWQGGRPWREVLQAMLARAGLTAVEKGQVVTIAAASPSGAPVVSVNPPAAAESADVAPLAPVVMESSPVVVAPVVPESAAPVPAETPIVIGEAAAPVVVAPPAAGPVVGRLVNVQVMPSAEETWEAAKGHGLRDVLEAWCRRANVELLWSAEYDYPVQATVVFTGSFEDAVRSLLGGFAAAKPQPVGRLHNNPAANQRLLVIEARGNNYGE